MGDLIALTRTVDVRLADRPPRFAQALTLVFVAARLWDRIDWPWWWLASPMWVAVLVFFVEKLLGAVSHWAKSKLHEGEVTRG